jgi:hypothetical protein
LSDSTPPTPRPPSKNTSINGDGTAPALIFLGSGSLPPPRMRLGQRSALLTREDARPGQRARYGLTEPAIQLVPVFVQLGGWGLRHRPTSSALNARAELLEQGGPALWQEFMDEVRHSYLAPIPHRPDQDPATPGRIPPMITTTLPSPLG